MKIAISFYGQPRFYKEAFTQWERYINELNADVYVHTWWGEDMVGELYPCAPHAKSYLHDGDMLVKGDVIEGINKLYKPKILEYNSYKTFPTPIWATKNTPKEHAVFQFYTQYRSKELIKKSNINYDIVIRTRMDLHVNVPIQINVAPNVINTASCEPHRGIPNDLLSISDLNTFEKISNTYINLSEFLNNVKGYEMEYYLASQMKKEGVTHRTFPASYPTFDMMRSNNLHRLDTKLEKIIL